jgi:tetratricopeptide (TPR) repeat protein
VGGRAADAARGGAGAGAGGGDRAGFSRRGEVSCEWADRSLTWQGIAAFREGAYDQATDFLEDGLRLAGEPGDGPERALAQFNLGIIADFQGNQPLARTRIEAALALARQTGDTYTIIRSLNALAVVTIQEGNLAGAETALHESLALARALASRGRIAYALLNLGGVDTQRGRHGRAEEHLRERVLLARTVGDRYLLVGSLGEYAKLAAACGQAERAARLGGAEAKLQDERGIAFPVGEVARREQALTRARAQLGEDGFQRAWEDGQAMELEEAVRYALDEGPPSSDSLIAQAPSRVESC